jgi:hypothetical protein
MNVSHQTKLVVNNIRSDTVSAVKYLCKASGFRSGCYSNDDRLGFYTI